MATRQSMEDCLEQCESVLSIAKEQYKEASQQEHYNNSEFVQSQLLLESAYNDLEKLNHYANEEQKEQLQRMKIQLHQMRHDMISLRH
nr:YtzC family protein [Jeotgalibacillus soli]